MQQEQRLRTFLGERFHNFDESIGRTDDLTGIVDSLGLFELVEFVEQEFGVRIPTEQFSPRRFSTIHEILLLVEELRAP